MNQGGAAESFRRRWAEKGEEAGRAGEARGLGSIPPGPRGAAPASCSEEASAEPRVPGTRPEKIFVYVGSANGVEFIVIFMTAAGCGLVEESRLENMYPDSQPSHRIDSKG
jgi:hypothetical protein